MEVFMRKHNLLAKGSDIFALRFPTIKQLLRDDKVVPPLEV